MFCSIKNDDWKWCRFNYCFWYWQFDVKMALLMESLFLFPFYLSPLPNEKSRQKNDLVLRPHSLVRKSKYPKTAVCSAGTPRKPFKRKLWLSNDNDDVDVFWLFNTGFHFLSTFHAFSIEFQCWGSEIDWTCDKFSKREKIPDVWRKTITGKNYELSDFKSEWVNFQEKEEGENKVTIFPLLNKLSHDNLQVQDESLNLV